MSYSALVYEIRRTLLLEERAKGWRQRLTEKRRAKLILQLRIKEWWR